MIDIFIYNVVYIKCDFSKIRSSESQKLILIASPYCLNELSDENRACFDEIHPISRDFQQVDLDEIEKIVLQYLQEYGPENIRLLSNEDSTLLVCGHLREKYGISGHRAETLLPFVNKVVSKDRLKNVVRMPKYIQFDKQAYLENKDAYLQSLENNLGFPMFAKPVDLVSSIETHRIPDMDTLIHVLERIVVHDYDFEIDEFIDGELFHCDAMIIDGVMHFFMIGKCSFALSRFFEGKPVGSIPIVDQQMFNELKQFSQKVFDKLSCPSGAYHLEAFLDNKTGDFVFLEVGARTGGALITKVYEKLFNLNIEETNYLIQMGELKEINVTQKDIYAGFLNFPKIKGSLQSIVKPSLDIDSEFIEFVKPDDQLEQAANLLDISCSIIFWDECYDKIYNTFEYLKNYKPLLLQQESA
ncbi:TPA: hypothetical protein JAN60_07505 [Legionella pneumophila]|uniref:ATP-grasp domain-containing protein n=1 Tax=Legionella pneumophila TaxID=446 RepID=UPI0010AAE810|nr:hypothetical protein [Legionella pneumophila]TIG67080.1 hypothetical protein DI132_04210 [Legionella pneumophila]TIG72983.1 hypothetical protein DI104_05740 [Legionella pneumophila]HAT3863334.1 hypothetical protein [Legionella pneumophila]HAT3872667.1 hypothetical protein [Legionella pneumophila]HAT7047769.1 hypothetical protein [Legionella pneumophila]